MKQRVRKPLSEYRPLSTLKDEERNHHFETQYIDEELLQDAIDFYNGYFGYFKHPIDREEALAYADIGVRANSDLWKSMMPMSHEKMDFFYKITPLYFFHDILRFMDGIHRANFDKWINERLPIQKIDTILDFAGGTGGYSIMFAKRGTKVTFVDSNNLQCDWIRYIAFTRKLPITVYDSLSKVSGKFDGIIAQDVVEHVFDPVKLINKLHEYAQPDQKSFMSISEVPCCGPEEFAPMHFKVDGNLMAGEIKFKYIEHYKSMDLTLEEYRYMMRENARQPNKAVNSNPVQD